MTALRAGRGGGPHGEPDSGRDGARARLAGLTLVGLAGTRLSAEEERLLVRFAVAGVILFRRNVESLEQLRTLCAQVRAALAPVSPLPPLICADQEGGSVAPLAAAIGRPPAALALGLAADLELTRRVHTETARRLRTAGLGLVLAPVADVAGDENPVVSTRTFGSDPQLAAAHVAAAIEGLRAGGVAGCAKHWPGHGRPVLDSHVGRPTVEAGLEELERVELPPFRAAIGAGVEAVMVGHLVVPALDASGTIASASEPMLRLWLRERLKFAGAVITDALEMAGFGSTGPRAALGAGSDLLLFAAPAGQVAARLEQLERELAAGHIDSARLEQARAHVERLRAVAGQPDGAHTLDPFDDTLYTTARLRGLRVHAAASGSSATAGSRGSAAAASGRCAAAAQTTGSGDAATSGGEGRTATTSTAGNWLAGAVSRPVGWVLVDAASADRLMRAEPAADLAERVATAASLIEPVLHAHLGQAILPAVLLPSPTGPPFPRELRERLAGIPVGAGIIVASLRPFRPPEREAWRRVLAARQPAWVVLMGDLGLRHALVGLDHLLMPGAAPEDAELLGRILTGGVALPAAADRAVL